MGGEQPDGKGLAALKNASAGVPLRTCLAAWNGCRVGQGILGVLLPLDSGPCDLHMSDNNIRDCEMLNVP